MLPPSILSKMKAGMLVTLALQTGVLHARGDEEVPPGALAHGILIVGSAEWEAVIRQRVRELNSEETAVSTFAFRYLINSRESCKEVDQLLKRILSESRDPLTCERIKAVLNAVRTGHRCVELCGRG